VVSGSVSALHSVCSARPVCAPQGGIISLAVTEVMLLMASVWEACVQVTPGAAGVAGDL
jgi:hypothetical protein